MSAWVVSKSHIDVLVSALIAFDVDHGLGREPAEIGKALWAENVASVSDRYGLAHRDDERKDELAAYERAIEAYTWCELHDLKPGPVAKAAGCYEYQSCEHTAWAVSPAREAVRKLLERLAEKLPGYEAAPWGVDEERLAEFCNPGAVSLNSLVARAIFEGRGPVRKLRG